MSLETPRGKVVLYAAGGCGINIAARYLETVGQEVPGLAHIEPYFIDTSHANVSEGIPEERVFVLEDKEGSGKVRTENRVEIARAARPVLQRFTPGDLNLVIFSASGGTGSVFGPNLIAKLLEEGHRVVALVIGGDECERSATNTVNTIKSLEGIAKKTEQSVMMYYEHLKPTDRRSAIDDRIRFVITSLAYLASRRNRELDLSDITNFINISAVTSAAPQLTTLEVFRTTEEANTAAGFALAVASLLADPDAESIDFRPEYRTTSYPREGLPEKIKALHFVAGVDPIHGVFKNISKSADEISSAKKGRAVRDSIIDKDETDETGMVF